LPLIALTPTRRKPPASWSRSPTRFEANQDGRIYIEQINGPFLYEFNGSPKEYRAALKLAIDRGWLWLHESGTYVKFTQARAELFA
jgi:hypothetical protein